MYTLEKVELKETLQQPRKVVWFQVGKLYQIRTRSFSFALAKVTHKGEGNIDIEFFGAPRTKRLRRPDTPLCKALQPVLQSERLPIKTITEAQEVV